MTKRMKKTTVFAAFAAAALLVAGVGVSSPVTASAEDMVVGGVAQSGFTMTAGASLKAVDNEVGIRWQTNVTSEFEQYLADNYAGATVKYKTLVTGVNMLAGGDITAVTPDLKKPDSEEAACADLEGVLNEGTYEARIIYGAENPAEFEAIKDAAVRAELVARAYVEITTESGVEIIYAQADDTARAMQGVAAKALDGNNANDKAIASEYVNELANLREKQTKTVYYHYADGEKKNTMEVKDLPDGTYNAYIGAKRVGSGTVVDGVASGLDKIDVAKWSAISGDTATQKKHTIYFVNENNDGYLVDFINPTAIIMEASDLDVFKPLEDGATSDYTVRGYYVLGQDIDASAYTTKVWRKMAQGNAGTKALGLLGTLDGIGRTIDGITCNTGGIFGAIGWSGVVKNVAFTNVKVTTWSSSQVTGGDYGNDGSVIATTLYSSSTLENVYIHIENLNVGGHQQVKRSSVAYSISSQANLKNLVVNSTVNSFDKGYTLCSENSRVSSDTYIRDNSTLTTSTKWRNVHLLSRALPLDRNQPSVGENAYSEKDADAVRLAGVFEYKGESGGAIEAFKAAYADVNSSARASLDTFNPAYWSVVDNVLTWGAAAES